MRHIVGLDIGFAERRKTNAFAILRDDDLIVLPPMLPSERDAVLRELRDVDVIAIDAPILPPGTPVPQPRECEHVLSRGLFQTRCKPGMSHIPGTGQRLREHGRRAADLGAHGSAKVVEAFPNAFLGVALPDEVFVSRPKLKRGQKFDWLYCEWVWDARLMATSSSHRPICGRHGAVHISETLPR